MITRLQDCASQKAVIAYKTTEDFRLLNESISFEFLYWFIFITVFLLHIVISYVKSSFDFNVGYFNDVNECEIIFHDASVCYCIKSYLCF